MSIEKIYEIFSQSTGVNTDTRTIKKGDLFFALKGENFDGNKFVKTALDKGAVFAVISDPTEHIDGKTILVEDTLKTLQQLATMHRKKLNIKIFGITGTNGKTTTKELVYRVLSAKYKTFATAGNLNNHIGVPLTILNLPKDTEFAVIEMGANHPGEIAELCEISQPDEGLITNIGYAHLEGFGSLENLIDTKLALFRSISSKNGTFFLNNDDNILKEKIKYYPEVVKYGKTDDCQIRSTKIYNDIFLKIDVEIKSKKYTVESQLVGKYNRSNILAAISAGFAHQIAVEDILKAIKNYEPSNNRSQLYKTEKNTLILDMYNANPTSMKLSIENFADLEATNKMLIVGDMLELGKDEILEHQKIIDLIKSKNFEQVFLVGKKFGQCEFPNYFKTFENVDKLNLFLQKNSVQAHTILLKASNGTGLKKCVQFL